MLTGRLILELPRGSERALSARAAEFLAARGRAAACKRRRWIADLQRGLSECGRMEGEEEEEEEEDV